MLLLTVLKRKVISQNRLLKVFSDFHQDGSIDSGRSVLAVIPFVAVGVRRNHDVDGTRSGRVDRRVGAFGR